MKNFLVIGGTYFVGRVFTMQASKAGCNVTLINRGRYSMKNFAGVKEYLCDRHNASGLAGLPLEPHYDAVIDFCAYEPGDIRMVLQNLPCEAAQYIYISTADVCKKDGYGKKNEESPLLTEMTDDPAGSYAYKKMLLEKELIDICGEKGIYYTILRPAFVFGPYNYAPRESYYIEKIVRGKPVPYPEDATGEFGMVYVKDVADAILLCAEKTISRDEIYILCAPDILNYRIYSSLMEQISNRKIIWDMVSVREVLEKGIPLPFPLTKDESELFDGTKIVSRLGFSYSELGACMRLTYQAFERVFQI